MKNTIIFLGLLFFLLCGSWPVLQAQTTCYTIWQDDSEGTLSVYNSIVYLNIAGLPPDVTDGPAYSGAMATNAVDVDPGFTSINNYLITSASTAVYNTGTSSYNSPYTSDIKGNARIQGTSVDMGAYEVGIFAIPVMNFTTIASGSANWSSVSAWGGNLVPTTGASIIVQNDLTIDQDASVSSLILAPGARLTLATGRTLTATTLTINSDATGTGTFVDNGTSKITTANVQQYLTGNRNWYLSSPVAGPTVAALTGTTAVYSYNESTSAWVTETSGAVMTPGKGYVAANGTTAGTVTFSGTLNNGAQSSALTRSGTTSIGFNLAGNPYPSYVNWESATKTNLEPTIWYRSKNAGNTAYVYDTYSATGHVGTGLNGTNVTALIPPMQAFWVRVDPLYTSGTLAFDNTMRSHGSGINPLKVKAADSTPVQKILRLQVSNGVNHDEAIVLFNTNASDGYDTYDSEKISNANPAVPELYTLVGTEKCVINGLNAVTLNEELPLGFTTGEANTFSIQATEASNFDADTQILLKDNLLNTEQELVVGTAYVFASDVVSSASRFSVVFKSASVTTGIEPANQDNQQVMVYKNANNKLVVTRSAVSSTEGNITVTNAMGQKLVNVSTTGSITVIDKSFGSGVYVVTVTTGGKSTTKKVIMN